MTVDYARGWNLVAGVIHDKPPLYEMVLEKLFDEAQRKLLAYEKVGTATGIVDCVRQFDKTKKQPAIIRSL